MLFITGAGISADSGLPTYRGVGGLYNNGETQEGMPIEVALSGHVFERSPAITWKYILEIERACRGALPNRGHEVIALLEQRAGLRAWTLTQNVDGLHAAAGSENLIEMHGSVSTLRCTSCAWSEEVEDYTHLGELPPTCPACASVIRPDIILFGEGLPINAQHTLQRELDQGFDLVISIGTTSAFPYISWPIHEANSRGGRTVEINPGTTQISEAVLLKCSSGAAATLDAIYTALARL